MKLEFPLWLVLDPGPTSELADVRWQARDFTDLENAIIGTHIAGRPGYQTRSPALYTDEAEATRDAQARLDARDGKRPWISLSGLRPGAVFETKVGDKGTKIAMLADGRVGWIDVNGVRHYATGSVLVREVPL